MGDLRRGLGHRTVRRVIVAGVAGLAALVFLAVSTTGATAAAPLSIKIEGNHFVNGEGQTIRLLGVDVTSSEYACADNYAYDDGHFDDADAAQIASWNANAVRVPLNEDCWLDTELPPGDTYGGAGYQHEIEQYVADLNAHGIYAILDLHWSAPSGRTALEQQPMPDKDHSTAFWESVASAFKSNPAVVFDLFNEPFDPTNTSSGDDPDSDHKVTWGCWENGGCTTDVYNEEEERTNTVYTVVGMQTLLNAVRKVGATQPVMVGGLDYANDLSQWVDHAPDDPLNQEAASFHNYMGKHCDNVDCWNSEIAPVAANVPVVTGEFAEDNYEEPGCTASPNNFDNEYMSWADANGVSYLAWAWFVPDPPGPKEDKCSRYYLLGDYSGTPTSVNGIAVHAHLLTLPPGGRSTTGTTGTGTTGTGTTGSGSRGSGAPSTGGSPKPVGPKIKLLRFRPKVLPGGKVSFQLEAAESCQAAISGQTVKGYKLGGHQPHKVALGSGKLSLTADKPATVTIKLPAKALQLLQSQRSLKSRFTVTLSASGNTTTVASHDVSLEQPKPKKP